jgi:hypothetical protein
MRATHLHQCCLEEWVGQQHAASALQQRLHQQRPQPHPLLGLVLLNLLGDVLRIQLLQARAAYVSTLGEGDGKKVASRSSVECGS